MHVRRAAPVTHGPHCFTQLSIMVVRDSCEYDLPGSWPFLQANEVTCGALLSLGSPRGTREQTGQMGLPSSGQEHSHSHPNAHPRGSAPLDRRPPGEGGWGTAGWPERASGPGGASPVAQGGEDSL